MLFKEFSLVTMSTFLCLLCLCTQSHPCSVLEMGKGEGGRFLRHMSPLFLLFHILLQILSFFKTRLQENPALTKISRFQRMEFVLFIMLPHTFPLHILWPCLSDSLEKGRGSCPSLSLSSVIRGLGNLRPAPVQFAELATCSEAREEAQ